MGVVWHADESITVCLREFAFQFPKKIRDHLASGIQTHRPLCHMPKKAFPILGANGDEIKPWLGIVVSIEPNGPATMFPGMVGHVILIFSTSQVCDLEGKSGRDKNGGGSEIRTHGPPEADNGFRDRRLRPLSHSSAAESSEGILAKN